MSSVPRIEVVRGAPSEAEAAAIRLAILKVWRDQVIAAARGVGESRWVAASRAMALRVPFAHARRDAAWQESPLVDGGAVLHRRTGAGGAH